MNTRRTIVAAAAIAGVLMMTPAAAAQWKPPENLGPEVNSPMDELGPFIYEGNLYFSSTREGGLGGYDLYRSLSDLPWEPPENLVRLNTEFNERAPSLACDPDSGRVQIVFGCDRLGGYDVWTSLNFAPCPVAPPPDWETPTEVNVSTPDFESMPTLSPDGMMLIFGSDRPGSIGGYDLWVSYRGPAGWEEPENLGPVINSEYNEAGPALSPDGQILYFSSNRPGGVGAIDLWRSHRIGTEWTEPENLGPEINSEENDTCPQPTEDELYFRSTRPGGFGEGDLYVAGRLVEDVMVLDGPQFDPYEPVFDPVGPWHELWPVYCTPWECVEWIDNGTGVLDFCDYLHLQAPDGVLEWWHVERVTITVRLETAASPLYVEWMGPFTSEPFDPIGPWHEVFPNYCTPRECIGWDDTNQDGRISPSDWLTFQTPAGVISWHVLEVATDIEVIQQEPPPEGMILDGQQFDPYEPVFDPVGPWHELWPIYCTPWECVDWVDNGTGVLDYCDYLLLQAPDGVLEWWHVERVTITVTLETAANPMYVEWMGPFTSEPFDPIGPWHEVYPDFCAPWDCIGWDDTNQDGRISPSDWLTFQTPIGSITLHVLEVATDIEVIEGEPPPEGMILDGPEFDPYEPVVDPVGPWHELWPVYCTPWECVDWIDNGTGVLDDCDYLKLQSPDGLHEWWHVERVTLTVTLEGEPGTTPRYLEWLGPFTSEPFDPLGPWHEVYPEFCTPWECIGWDDTNGDGRISHSDWLTFQSHGLAVTLHVLAVATDIEVVEEEPPIPRKFLDGPQFDPYEPVFDPVGPWHELWPDFCMVWECVDWIDNGTGVLDYCDYLRFEPAVDPHGWWHVERVTFTVTVEFAAGDPPIYLDWAGPFPIDQFPFGPWHEVYPDFCMPWECVGWDDTNGDGRVGHSDGLTFETQGVTVTMHVLEIATDIEVIQERPPCPWDISGDGRVGFDDLLAVLSFWGPCMVDPCPADVNGDGIVGFDDLLEVLAWWGPCP